MKRLFLILVSVIMLLGSCQSKRTSFKYDPTVPYPLLNPGDFWPDKFDQRGLQNAIVHRDKIYCNTIDVGGNKNFIYCLNARNGLVLWRANVKAYASQPASFLDDIVVYVSYLGDIAAFDSEGNEIWKARFNHPYGGHWLDTVNAKLLVKTVAAEDVCEYGVKTGSLISDKANDSLQQLVEKNRNNKSYFGNYEYHFEANHKAYTIKCRPSTKEEINDCIVEIGAKEIL